MSEFQQYIPKSHQKIIYIDRTYSMNNYMYELYMLVIIAYCFSNREDEALKIYFNAVKDCW